MARARTLPLLALSLLALTSAPAWWGCGGSDDAGAPAGASGSAGGAGSGGSGAAGSAGESGVSGGGQGGGSGGGAPAEWDRPVTPLPADQASQQRSSCAFKAGALPGETLGDAAPLEAKIPIDHFVLVMMENRSFDHYFQKLPGAGVMVDVAPDDFSNKASSGKTEGLREITDYCLADTNHSWSGSHEQFNGGKMDGFVTSNEKSGQDGARALTYQTEQTAPFGYYLAKTWSISDRHFCSLLGPTWPNRMFFYAASSFGLTKNTFATEAETTLFDNLDQRQVAWRVYKSDTPGSAVFTNVLFSHKDNYVPMAQFFDDAKAGSLPAVTYVDPGLVGNAARQSSQHPPANHQFGEQFLYDVVKAVTESPLWGRTALVITYDEHGGFYDHVPPPTACPPDDRPITEGADLGAFDRLGFRVPLFVISPFAKKAHVSHVVTDHTSIVRLIEARFKLPALSARDANAEAIYDLFDFDNPAFMTPPALPERPPVDEAQDAKCKSMFP